MSISPTLRMPFMYVEFDPSRAFQGPSVLAYNALLIGQLTSSGTKYNVSANAVGPFRVTSSDQAAQYFGAGSMAHRMSIGWFGNNKSVPLDVVGMKDNGSNKSEGSIAISGTPSAAGTLYLYVNGKQYQITVTTSDTATTIGDSIEAAITADTSSPVTAANSAGTVTFTAKNAGTKGNEIDLRVNYNDGEVLPTGVSATITAMGGVTSGSGDPDVSDAIALLGDKWYNIVLGQFSDATNLALIESELSDRFGPLRMIDGVYISGRRGTLSELSTFGDARNSPHVSIIHAGGVSGVGTPTWSLELAAMYAGRIAQEGQADPARPFQTLELVGALPPAITEEFDSAENNSLLFDGISTWTVDSGGKIRIARAITQYQTNASGSDDIAYLDVNTMLTLMYLRYDFRTKIQNKYPRAKLADDGVQISPTQQVITPKVGKAEAIAIFRGWEFLGLVENIDQFKEDLQCYRSTTDPNRLEWVLPPDLINQFRIGAATIQFLLQSPSI